MVNDPSNVPIPDPTTLTYQAIQDSISNLKELLQAEIYRVEGRLDAYQETHEALHAHRLREVDAEIKHLTELMAERFAGIDATMVERDNRVTDSAQAGKDAIHSSLISQKEMADKAEAGFTKQMDSLQAQIHTLDEARQEQVRQLEKRVDTRDGAEKGVSAAFNNTLSVAAILIAAAAVIVTIIVST